MTQRIVLLLAALLAALSSISVSAAPVSPATSDRNPGLPTCRIEPNGLLLVVPVDPDVARLDVVDAATGDTIGLIAMPRVTAFLRASDPAKAYALTARGLYVVDATANTATKLDIPATIAATLSPDGPLTRGSAGTRFQILGDRAQTHVYLIDLDHATAVDLLALLPQQGDAPRFASEAKITANDRAAVIWNGKSMFVVDTGDPTSARQIGGDAFLYTPELSPDGTRIAFGRRLQASASEIVVAQIADGSEQIVRSDLEPLLPLWVPGANKLVIDRRPTTEPTGELISVDLTTRVSTRLLEYRGAVLSVQFTPDGSRALTSVDQADVRAWFLLDLVDGGATGVPDATGQTAFPGLFAPSLWALMTPTAAAGGAGRGSSYASLDLATAAYVTLLDQVDPTGSYSLPLLARDGSAALVEETTGGSTRLWLFGLAQPSSSPIPGATIASAAIAPGGCWVAASVDDTVRLVPVAGGATRELPGAFATWVTAG